MPAQPVLAQSADLRILDTGLELERDAGGRPLDRLAVQWFKTWEAEAGREYTLYRAVKLYLLKHLPQEARRDPALVDKMRAVLSGLHTQRRARFQFTQLLAGMWQPKPLGVVQIYGVIGLGESLDEARRNAQLGGAALVGALSNFVQAIVEPLTIAQVEWLINAYSRMRTVSVFVGHPDERLAAKGGGREGPGEVVSQPAEPGVTGQQIEMFLRPLVNQQVEFVAPLLASPVDTAILTQCLSRIADEASVVASLQTGGDSVSAGIAISLGLSTTLAQSVGNAFGQMRGQSQARTLSVAESRTHTVGRATTTGHTVTDGSAHSTGFATSSGRSVTETTSTSSGAAHSDGSAHTDGSAHSTGSFSSTSSSSGVSGGVAHSVVDTASQSQGGAAGISLSAGSSASESHGANLSGTHTESSGGGEAWNYQHGATRGVSGGIPGLGGNMSENASLGRTDSTQYSSGDSASVGISSGQSTGTSQGMSVSGGVNWSSGQSHAEGSTVSSGWSYSSSSSSGASVSDTSSQSDTASQSDTTSQGVAHSVSVGTFSSSTSSVSDTTSHSESFSTAHTRSESDSEGEAVSRGVSSATSDGVSVGRSLGMSQGFGMGLGGAPNFGISQTYQWFDDQAIQYTQILRSLEELYRRATLEGGYTTAFYVLMANEEGAIIAETAVRQAFQGNGPQVVTPVQARRLPDTEQEYIRLHAQAFCPSTRSEIKSASYETYRDATLLTATQLAAYTAPALFEEGIATTVLEKTPPFGLYPDLAGNVTWGFQFSTERSIAHPTQAPLRLDRSRLFHTAFAADSGFGKSVAAERLAYESARAWHTQTVVLDFGAGWRKLLKAPGLEGHVEVWQLQPGGLAPFRWNPWQVGRRIRPERQLPATCEIFRNAGRMGERQLGYMRRAATQMWQSAGVMTFSAATWQDARWGYVHPNEWDVLEPLWAAGNLTGRQRVQSLPLSALTPGEKQALAVQRSRSTGIAQWLGILTRELDKQRNPNERSSLEGLLLRLEAFTTGEMLDIYGPSAAGTAVEELGLLGPERWGVSILEGGAEMDDYTKSVVMGLVAWHLYNDAVVRRRERINWGVDAPLTQIYFEEANKVLSGVDTGLSDDGGGSSTSSQFQTMWRDGRKYGIYLHLMVQSPSELPPGILSSCANLVVGKLGSPVDRDVVQAQLGWSEKGFTDEDYKRYISRMPQARMIIRLGYTPDPTQTAPMLVRPLLLDVVEPTDAEIWQAFRDLRGGGL